MPTTSLSIADKLTLMTLGFFERKKLRLQERLARAQVDADPSTHFMAGAEVQNITGNPAKIRIGAETMVCGRLIAYGHSHGITVGKYCFIGMGANIWSADRIVIGNRVSISHGTDLFDNDYHPVSARERHEHHALCLKEGRLLPWPTIRTGPIVIEDDVAIGCHVTILRGVTIGRGAVVGANTLVAKDVPPWTIVSGPTQRFVTKLLPEDEWSMAQE
jgi:acetyltransferase-like isoleucine patch superfamily enzyme